jgi:hypothetical protein
MVWPRAAEGRLVGDDQRSEPGEHVAIEADVVVEQPGGSVHDKLGAAPNQQHEQHGEPGVAAAVAEQRDRDDAEEYPGDGGVDPGHEVVARRVRVQPVPLVPRKPHRPAPVFTSGGQSSPDDQPRCGVQRADSPATDQQRTGWGEDDRQRHQAEPDGILVIRVHVQRG